MPGRLRQRLRKISLIEGSSPIRPDQANYTDDCKVNFLDYAVFAQNWLSFSVEDPCPFTPEQGNHNDECVIDARDLMTLLDNWLLND